MAEDVEKEDVERGNISSKIAMPNLSKLLSVEEKKYLLAVERGDMGNVKRMLQQAHRRKTFDINCVDSLGRGALTISIDQENLEMVELLIIMGVATKDALLHAINVEFVEAVELLLEHEELIHKEGEPYSWQKVDENTASFTPDITPLILAAHRNNYEILKILLDRGATLPMPHDIKCGCEECIILSQQDSLRQALSRLNEYRALASPSLIALSSSDPILTAFQLSWELRALAFAEPESKSEYMELRRQCQQFAVDLLHQSRSSHELAIILNHDPDDPTPYEEGEHMKLSRLELAIEYKQKKFVAHSNIQQLLAAIWYEGVPGFRRKTNVQKIAIIIKVALLFPFYCMLYIVAPNTKTGKLMRKPFMKFLIHASSYLFFLLILILVSQRVEDLVIEYFGTESWKDDLIERKERQRGNPPMILEYVVFIYVIGFIFEETHEMISEGLRDYLRNMWNIIDFTRNFLYTAVIILRWAAYVQQKTEIAKNPATAYLRREDWAPFDFQLVAEGLFAAANIFSAVKLVHLFSINPHLGPLQISLGRMVIDIVKFFFIYSLVLFAFACGLNQLLWYFANLERNKCFHLPNETPDFENFGDSCMKWRRFANVFESSQSLFWASFGLVDLSSFELAGIKTYTRFWGLLMFGSYSVINVIVLLNLLIAMMSNSYAIIEEHSDTEWKFARTKLWMSYFEETLTLPPPFNIFPTPKMILKLFRVRKKDKLRRLSTKRRIREEKERDYKYSAVMRSLVWRYVTAMHKKVEENPITEDDVSELKSDISSFRFEIMEVLHRNGMNVSSAERQEKAIFGKKNKVWERRLMKDFKVGPIATDDDEALLYATPPENESPTSRFRRVAKMAILNSGMNKWRQVVKGVCIASQIGHCHNRDSFKKQQNLQRAMIEAKNLAARSPLNSRPITPIDLPDTTGSNILNIIKDVGTSGMITPIVPGISTVPLSKDLICMPENQNNLNASENRSCNSPTFKFILSNEFCPSIRPYSPTNSYKESSAISLSENDGSSENNPVEKSYITNHENESSEDSFMSIDIKDNIRIILEEDPQQKLEEKVNDSTLVPETIKEEEDSTSQKDFIVPRSPLPTKKLFLSNQTIANASPDNNEKKFDSAVGNEDVIIKAPNSSAKDSTPLQTKPTTEPQMSKSEKSKTLSVRFSPTLDEKTEEPNKTNLKDKSSESLAPAMRRETRTEMRDQTSTVPVTSIPTSTITTSIMTHKKDENPSISATRLSPGGPNKSPSMLSDEKSPLATRNIHRVPKKYQPKYGWL